MEENGWFVFETNSNRSLVADWGWEQCYGHGFSDDASLNQNSQQTTDSSTTIEEEKYSPGKQQEDYSALFCSQTDKDDRCHGAHSRSPLPLWRSGTSPASQGTREVAELTRASPMPPSSSDRPGATRRRKKKKNKEASEASHSRSLFWRLGDSLTGQSTRKVVLLPEMTTAPAVFSSTSKRSRSPETAWNSRKVLLVSQINETCQTGTLGDPGTRSQAAPASVPSKCKSCGRCPHCGQFQKKKWNCRRMTWRGRSSMTSWRGRSSMTSWRRKPGMTSWEHMPTPIAPPTGGGSYRGRYRYDAIEQCHSCKGKGIHQMTAWKCRRCMVPLCLSPRRNCFAAWHGSEDHRGTEENGCEQKQKEAV